MTNTVISDSGRWHPARSGKLNQVKPAMLRDSATGRDQELPLFCFLLKGPNLSVIGVLQCDSIMKVFFGTYRGEKFDSAYFSASERNHQTTQGEQGLVADSLYLNPEQTWNYDGGPTRARNPECFGRKFGTCAMGLVKESDEPSQVHNNIGEVRVGDSEIDSEPILIQESKQDRCSFSGGGTTSESTPGSIISILSRNTNRLRTPKWTRIEIRINTRIDSQVGAVLSLHLFPVGLNAKPVLVLFPEANALREGFGCWTVPFFAGFGDGQKVGCSEDSTGGGSVRDGERARGCHHWSPVRGRKKVFVDYLSCFLEWIDNGTRVKTVFLPSFDRVDTSRVTLEVQSKCQLRFPTVQFDVK
ncbi:hypothetical protein DFH08DRAFT_934412, partial [Mycena albidolilacea]